MRRKPAGAASVSPTIRCSCSSTCAQRTNKWTGGPEFVLSQRREKWILKKGLSRRCIINKMQQAVRLSTARWSMGGIGTAELLTKTKEWGSCFCGFFFIPKPSPMTIQEKSVTKFDCANAWCYGGVRQMSRGKKGKKDGPYTYLYCTIAMERVRGWEWVWLLSLIKQGEPVNLLCQANFWIKIS